MPRLWQFWMLFGPFLMSSLGPAEALNLDLTLNHQRDGGFFLKPLSDARRKTNYNVEKRTFVFTQPSGSANVRAAHGTYTVEQTVSPGLLQASLGNQTVLNDVIIQDLDISAHIVARSIMPERPILQVLFHASQVYMSNARDGSKSRSIKNTDNLRNWCLHVHVKKDEQELTSVCVLNVKDNVCMAEVTLPKTWWPEHQIGSADVYYSVYPIDKTLQCSSSSNSIRPDKKKGKDKGTAEETPQQVKNFVSSVTLTHTQLAYQEVQEDQHVLLYIPQKSFYPGSRFKVPVKLQAESDLSLFVVRVKARHGVKIVDAEASPGLWHISLDLNHKQKGAMVTAFVTNSKDYSKTDKVQPIFEWIFEVEKDAVEADEAGRLMFNLEYEMNSKMSEKYGSIQNRVVARIQIQHDDVFTIVPMIKTTEIMNTAMLTGRIQNYPMRIYSVGQMGKVVDITALTTCHSGDEGVLKVAPSCNLVYLDGSEEKGSGSVSVIAKFGHHTKFLFFRVWVPELPLDIQVSDNKLSQIKSWRVPKHQKKEAYEQPQSRRRSKRTDKDLLTHPGLTSRDDREVDDWEDKDEDEYATSCRLRFQQALVKVYSRFYVEDPSGKNQYLVHKKAYLDVTDLVMDKLRVADTYIAALSGNLVEGLKPGRTEVQVLFKTGRVIGAKEIKVGNDKVSIDRISVDVVSSLNMDVSAEAELPGTLTLKVGYKSQLRKKYQEGELDVSILYSDDTSIPLEHVAPTDYFLDMDTLNNHIIAFGPMLMPNQPRIIALGQGKGELLKLALELGDSCQKKKSKALATAYVYVDVDFTKDKEDDMSLQSDMGGTYNFGNHASDRDDEVNTKPKYGKDADKHDAANIKPHHPDDHDRSHAKDGIPIDLDLAQLAGTGDYLPQHEAQQQHITQAMGMTPLEIGMYVLLGVFCLAIVVFMVNCVVYVVRHRRKRIPKDTKENIQQAHDWVWIGRATLERNAINTACSQALMPDADFNGNQSTPPLDGTIPRPSNRNSGCSSGGNSNSSSSGGGGGGGGGGSNRNSVVSTYKGSECSIRITTNPLMPEDNNGNSEHPEPGPSGETSSELPAPPKHTQSLNRNLRPPPPPPNLDQYSSHETVEWDYEAMGMSYDQLMEYFDNLKESTA